MPQNHLEYYMALESDLEKCSRYVDFSETNFTTHSLEFARIIMAACAEIDTIAKEFCNLINTQSTSRNILEYANEILSVSPNITKIEIASPRYNLKVKPWDSWGGTVSPNWWKANNNIKHDRANNYEDANFFNALSATGGLLSILLYFYNYKDGKQLEISAFDGPRLLCVTDGSQGGDWENGGIFWSYNLL